jgi:hypothetical protein
MAATVAAAAELISTANQIAGMPFIGVVTSAVQLIAQRCQDVSVQKVSNVHISYYLRCLTARMHLQDKCLLLCRTCHSLLVTLSDLHEQDKLTSDTSELHDAMALLGQYVNIPPLYSRMC